MIKCGKAFLSCALRLSELVPITLKNKDQVTKKWIKLLINNLITQY